MTKNNELRIGNFVQNSEGKICTVSQLFMDSIKEDEQITIKCNPPGKGSETVHFIPLTSALLNDIGFSKKKVGSKLVYSNGSINLTTDFRLCIIYESTTTSVGEPLQHLHRLQNLHFNLFGTEMVIMKDDVSKGAKKQ